MEIPNKIVKYINYIINIISKDKTYTKQEFLKIKVKLFDYILIKLYDKLYPAYPEDADLEILKNCYKLSWIESKHFIKDKEKNNYDIFIDDIKQLFTELENNKSPRKKLIAIGEIYKTVDKIIKFNGGKKDSGGAEEILNILLYLIVRSRPKKIYSDIKYVKLFLSENNGVKDFQLTHLISICNILKDITYEKLNGVTEQEFKEKCKEALISI